MNGVEQLLPHRKPFLFLDQIDVRDDGGYTGTHHFGPDEYFFAGHFPEYPVVPGVILIESMAQCGGAGVVKAGLCTSQIIFLASVSTVKFRRQVRPGDTVRIDVENIKVTRRLVRQRGKVWVDDELAAEAEWVCVVGKG